MVKYNKANGFTFIELLFAAAIFAFAIGGIASLFLNTVVLNETNRGTMLAYTGIQSKMEEVKNQAFDNIASYNNSVFDLSGFASERGMGKVFVTVNATSGGNTTRYRIQIDGCFNVGGRTIGNSITNCTSSPVELTTLISK